MLLVQISEYKPERQQQNRSGDALGHRPILSPSRDPIQKQVFTYSGPDNFQTRFRPPSFRSLAPDFHRNQDGCRCTASILPVFQG
jgi:hypothetical protein